MIRCSERFRTVTTLAGAFVLAAGFVLMLATMIASCGDVLDREVACDGGSR